MLAFSQHNLGLSGDQNAPNWAYGQVLGPLAPGGGGTNTHTHRQPDTHSVSIYFFDLTGTCMDHGHT